MSCNGCYDYPCSCPQKIYPSMVDAVRDRREREEREGKRPINLYANHTSKEKTPWQIVESANNADYELNIVWIRPFGDPPLNVHAWPDVEFYPNWGGWQQPWNHGDAYKRKESGIFFAEKLFSEGKLIPGVKTEVVPNYLFITWNPDAPIKMLKASKIKEINK